MTPLRLLRLSPIVAVLFAVLPGCAAKSPRSFRLAPIPDPSYAIESGTVVLSAPTLRITVTPIDDAARAAFIRSHASAASDPFAADSSGRPRYLTFRIIAENRGDADPIVFQPHMILLAQQTGERISPLGFPQAYTLLAGRTSSDPRLLDDLSKYMFDIDATLGPGERIDRLLIYPAEKVGAKRLRMEFSVLDSPSSRKSFDVLFVKEPLR